MVTDVGGGMSKERAMNRIFMRFEAGEQRKTISPHRTCFVEESSAPSERCSFLLATESHENLGRRSY